MADLTDTDAKLNLDGFNIAKTSLSVPFNRLKMNK